MTWLASVAVPLACLGGCLPLYEPRDLSAEESRLEAESGGGLAHKDVQSDALDGRSFPIVFERSHQDAVSSELKFAHGKLDSELCRGQPGHSQAPYVAEGWQDASIHFTSETTSGDVTTLWSGTVKGDMIAGTVETSQPGEDPVVRTFQSATNDDD